MAKILRKKLSQLASFIANPMTFAAAVVISIVWTVMGFFEKYSDTWYKTTNTILELTTFVVVFIVQFSEESETVAIQKKLDEIIKALPEAEQKLIGAEKKFKGESESEK